MIVEVLGIKRDASFVPKGKEEKDRIFGSRIYVRHLLNGIEGYYTDNYFLNASTFNSSSIKPGDELDIQYNRFGKVGSFTIIDSSKK